MKKNISYTAVLFLLALLPPSAAAETSDNINAATTAVSTPAAAAESADTSVQEDAVQSMSVIELFDKVTAPASPAIEDMEEREAAAMQAAEGKRVIVLGTFSTKANADAQLDVFLSSLDKQSEIVQLQQEYGFDYLSKVSGQYYVVTIEPFADDGVLNRVLSAVKEVFPDAYIPVIAKAKETIEAEPAPAAQHAARVPEKAEAAAAVPETAKVAAKQGAAAEETAADSVQPEGPVQKAEARAAEMAETQIGVASVTALSDTEVDEEEGMRTPQKAPLMSTKSVLLGAAALFAFLFLILFFVARRKPKQKIKAIEVTERAEAFEVNVRPEPAAKAASVEAEAIGPVALEVPTEAAAPVEAAFSRPRKKREARGDRDKIVKEDFAEFSGARILVAEDNLINQKVILGLLGESGMEVTIANDGQEALDILEADSGYQLVLMDAHMPRVDGFEATRRIRANPDFEHIAVAALSGDTGADDIRKMREAGMEEQLEKPLNMDALYDVLYCYVEVPSEAQKAKGVGLNREAGLEITGGDEELYDEILSDFASMYGDSDATLEALFSVRDFAQAQALLLDIKSLAANIGAQTLSDTAEELREALISGEEGRYAALLSDYQAQLHTVLVAI